jgi:hypothetical protein
MADRISRGEIISLLAGLPMAVAATTGMAAAAAAADDSGGTKKTYAYVTHPVGGKQCSTCSLFKAPNACQVVKGKISPTAYCKIYAKKA